MLWEYVAQVAGLGAVAPLPCKSDRYVLKER